MAMMMEFAMEPALEKELADKKADKGTRWIRILIKDEKLVHDGSGKATDDGAEDLKKLQAEASENEPFYGLINATDDNEWIVLAYIPDTSKVKQRMQYSSSLPSLKNRLGAMCIGDVRITEKDEIEWKTLDETVAKKKGRVDNTDVMSSKEKSLQEANTAHDKEVTERIAAPRTSAHTISFPIEADAKEALEKLAKGDLRAVVIKNESEKFLLDTTLAEGKIEDVAAKLGKESRFIGFIHKHDGEEKHMFVYFASDQCPVKKRMLYASSKSACFEHAVEAGCDFAKRLEFSEACDITTAELDSALAPVEEEPEEEEKPKPKAPANRGPRMLI